MIKKKRKPFDVLMQLVAEGIQREFKNECKKQNNQNLNKFKTELNLLLNEYLLIATP